MNSKPSKQQESKELSLDKAAQLIVNESRVLIPGIQTLFGFQLIAVFQPPFFDMLTSFERALHLLAMVLIVIATILIMAPATYHRQMEVQHVTDAFIQLATRLIVLSAIPLATSICLDVYLVSRMISNSVLLSAVIGLVLFASFMFLWIILPRTGLLQQTLGDER